MRKRLNGEGWIAAGILFLWFVQVASSAPMPYYPPDEARFWTGDPVPYFSWSSSFGAIGYYLEFDDYNDWNPALGGVEVSGTYFDLGIYLAQDGWDPLVFNLYWRVRPVLYDGTLGEPGPVRHFSKTTADPPETWEPRSYTFLRPWSRPVTLTWSPYPEAEWYFLQFADNIEFHDPYGEMQWGVPFFNTEPYISPNDWHYSAFNLFWRVSARDKWGNLSPWGEGSGFAKLGYRRVVAYGDSITGGFGSEDFESGFGGYPPLLLEKLQNRDDRCSVTTRWFPGGKAEDGAFNISDTLWGTCGGVVISMFGTVDIIDPGHCQDGDCRTVQRLQEITQYCNDLAVVSIICTVIPYNPAGGHPKYPDVTVIQSQLDEINNSIRAWCTSEDIPLADLDQAMRDHAPDGDLSALYYDWAHPNDQGYAVMADALAPVVIAAW